MACQRTRLAPSVPSRAMLRSAREGPVLHGYAGLDRKRSRGFRSVLPSAAPLAGAWPWRTRRVKGRRLRREGRCAKPFPLLGRQRARSRPLLSHGARPPLSDRVDVVACCHLLSWSLNSCCCDILPLLPPPVVLLPLAHASLCRPLACTDYRRSLVGCRIIIDQLRGVTITAPKRPAMAV